MGRLATLSEYPVVYEHGENISALLKAMDFRIDLDGLQPCEALYEHTDRYIQVEKSRLNDIRNAGFDYAVT